MDDAEAVEVLHAKQNLAHDVPSLLFCEALPVNDAAEELAAFKELGHNDERVRPVKDVKRLDDVLVVDRLQDGRLALDKLDLPF